MTRYYAMARHAGGENTRDDLPLPLRDDMLRERHYAALFARVKIIILMITARCDARDVNIADGALLR